MKVYRGRGLGDFYYQLIRDLMKEGRRVTVRGMDCMEMPDRVCLEYVDPGYCWMRIPGRKWNPFLPLAEIPWILSGNGNVEWISYYSSKMRDFADEGNSDFHGAYGLRIRKYRVPSEHRELSSVVEYLDQISAVVEKLRRDPFSRQAIINLWDPFLDNAIKTKDIPCNNWIAYELRDGVLNQSVVIRSNDLVWGTPVNAVQFTHIHAHVAGMLGVKMGTLTYFIQNLHVYLDLYKPTLANLVERAYDDEHPIIAECADGFSTFNDEELKDFVEDVELSKREPFYAPAHRTSGYLGSIAEMLHMFSMVKNGSQPNHRMLEMLADVREPFRYLMIDFWESSNNKLANYAANFLRRNNDVAA